MGGQVAAQITCPHCGQVYGLTPEQVPQYAGQTINCTACGKPFTVPGGPSASAAPSQPPKPGAPPAYPDQPTQPLPYAAYQRQRPNGLAVASLVSGIIG